MILEFSTRATAQQALAVINAMAATWWEAQGYTVVTENSQQQLVGKINGVDAPDNQRTLSWDVEQESPDGTWYFRSLTGNPLWVDWKDLYSDAGGPSYVEKEKPASWLGEQ